MVDDKPIDGPDTPSTILYYYARNGAQYISSFELVFPDMEVLEGEAGIILEESGDYTYSKMVNEISGYLYEFYGKPDKQDVIQFMEKDLGLKR